MLVLLKLDDSLSALWGVLYSLENNSVLKKIYLAQVFQQRPRIFNWYTTAGGGGRDLFGLFKKIPF